MAIPKQLQRNVNVAKYLLLDIQRSCNTAFVQMWRLSVVHLLRKLSKKRHERLCPRPVTRIKESEKPQHPPPSRPLSALIKPLSSTPTVSSSRNTIADQKVASTLTNPDVVDYRAMWEYYQLPKQRERSMMRTRVFTTRVSVARG